MDLGSSVRDSKAVTTYSQLNEQLLFLQPQDEPELSSDFCSCTEHQLHTETWPKEPNVTEKYLTPLCSLVGAILQEKYSFILQNLSCGCAALHLPGL